MSVRLHVVDFEARIVPGASDGLPVLPAIDGVMQVHLQQVAALGEQLGNRENVFAKVGDSNTAYPQNLTALGAPGYNPVANGLAGQPDLIATWAAYDSTLADGTTNSFARNSIGAHVGWSSPQLRANLAAEIAAIHPAIAIIMIGTNDIGTIDNLPYFQQNLTAVIEICLNDGVIPVVSTIPDLLQHPQWEAQVPEFNAVIEQVAAAEDVPLWDFHQQSTLLANAGLGGDNIHLSISPYGSGELGGSNLAYGANLRNYTTLQVLTKVRSIVFDNATPDDLPPLPDTTWTPVKPGEQLLVVGSGPGQPAEVAVYDANTHQLLSTILPYGPNFRGGVTAAVGDVTGDGIPDIVTAPGAGGGPLVEVFSGATGQLVESWLAFDPSFRGGVTVAVGDVNGQADVVVGSGPGGGPEVRVFDGSDGAPVTDFFAYDPSFRGGVNVAMANGDILTGAGVGGAPVLAEFDPLNGRMISSMYVFDPSFRGGITVAAGDTTGNGVASWVVGAGPGGAPMVRVFDPATNQWVAQSTPFDSSSRAGVRVAVAGGTVFAGEGWMEGSSVQGLDGAELDPFTGFQGGVFIGG